MKWCINIIKVMEGISEMVDFVKEHKPEYFENNNHQE